MALRLQLAAAALACAACTAGHAMGLAEAFEAARRHDAQFRAAGHELDSVRRVVPIARAGLRPNVSLNASMSDVTGKREFDNSLNQDVRVPVAYTAPQASVQLRSPLFNQEALLRYEQAGVQVQTAEAQYDLRASELADRLGMAYLQALLAHDSLALAEAEQATFENQLARAQQRQLRGEGTRTEVAQTQASLDVARVRVLEARTQLDIARHALRRITGQDPATLANLAPGYAALPLQPAALQAWIDLGEERSAQLRFRRRNLESAQLAVRRNRAQHLPRVDIVASLSRSRNESLSSLNQASTLRSVGLQFNVPLYAGGGIEAGVEQALADQARAEEDFRTDREAMQLEIQRHYSAVSTGAAKIEAYRRAVDSSEVAVEGATRAQAAGVGTNSEVIEAQSKRFAALRDLAQARYDLLASRLRLHLQSGAPVAEAVADVDRSLTIEFPYRNTSQP